MTSDLPVADPYELCFALISLAEKDDTLPWLYGASIAMLRYEMGFFPWINIRDEDKKERSGSEPLRIVLPDRNEKKYIYGGKRVTLPQIIFNTTGYITPSDVSISDEDLCLLYECGIDQSTRYSLLNMISILNNAAHRKTALNLDKEYLTAEPEEEKKSREELTAKVKELEAEVKRLNSELYSTEKRAKDAEDALSEYTEESKAEHQELTGLRELIFTINNTEANDEKADEQISFPYEVRHKTVVFGGNIKWINAMKSLFKGEIRFIPSEMLFDVSIIKNAETVWIHTNGLKHQSFYRIINNVREYNIPLRYFQHNSAVKCASQIVGIDNGSGM